MAKNSKKEQEEKKVSQAEDKAPEKPKKAKDTQEEIPAFVDEILKSHTDYSELYIDSLGGIYAPGTPEPVRGKAKLYKNKYHK